MQSDGPAVLLQVVRCISHDDRMAGEGQHLDVIVIIADGHYLGAIDATIVGPALQRVSLRASRVEDVGRSSRTRVTLGSCPCRCPTSASRWCPFIATN